ncbi:MAG: MogA/MoaB family molybdenum cofactor biosynthesis protein [Chloroflexi bacterium]|nr:MogA/MoaB family molybdenum cofactor biosynthesis protein [Chloroflexota bacterium]
MIRAAVLTISDRGAQGLREDLSGPAARRFLVDLGAQVVAHDLVPDDRSLIEARLRSWADGGAADLIVTTGGTGLAVRDVTPEATLAVIERPVPGMAEAMRAAALKTTPLAMLSRAVVGQRGRTLIVNLPGSPRAVVESLEALRPALPHAIAIIKGEATEH